MKSKKISTLSASIALLLAAGLLSGCAGEAEEGEGEVTSKEIVGEPILTDEAVIEPIYDAEYAEDIGNAVIEGGDNFSDIDGVETMPEMFDDAVELFDETVETIGDEAMDMGDISDDIVTDSVEEFEAEAASIIEEVEQTLAVVDDGADVVTITSEIIRGIQQSLTNAGFNPGPADGISGPRTMGALASFQEQNGLAAGQVTKDTLRALGVDF